MAEKENKATTRNSDNMTAGLCFIALFLLLILTAIFSSTHPLDFMVNFLTKMTAYIFLLAGIAALGGLFLYYWKLSSPDPDKTFSEATRDNLEYSRDVTMDITQTLKKYYAEYQERVKEAEEEAREEHEQENKPQKNASSSSN